MRSEKYQINVMKGNIFIIKIKITVDEGLLIMKEQL